MAYRFSTKYLDAETDMYYYGYRYYNPELGRWISRDPVPSEMRYLMVNNCPVCKYDYLGLTCVINGIGYVAQKVNGQIKVAINGVNVVCDDWRLKSVQTANVTPLNMVFSLSTQPQSQSFTATAKGVVEEYCYCAAGNHNPPNANCTAQAWADRGAVDLSGGGSIDVTFDSSTKTYVVDTSMD
jgi:RHS repeat-associated protein